MTGWRLWTVWAAHAAAIAVMLARWAGSGNGDCGIAEVRFAICVAITFLPVRRKGRRA